MSKKERPMQDVLSIITGLSRPRLLVSAARFGIDNYRRSTQLPRLLGCSAAPRTGPAAMQLVSIEADLNEKRRNNAADYSVARHVDILIALMAEAQLIRASATTLQGIT
jgi:hypothetical protein